MKAHLISISVAAAVIAGCGEAGSAGGDATVVDMTDALQFEPRTITIATGTELRFDNVGNVAHTVTADPKKVADASLVELPPGVAPFDSGLVSGGESFSHTFEEPGTYRYVCIPHQGARMVATVVVEG